MWWGVDVLRVGCWTWVCVVSAIEAAIHLRYIWSVPGDSGGANTFADSPLEGWGLDRLRRHRMSKIAAQEHLGKTSAMRNSRW